jgi:glycosyltransferase involved in cell wall biosynthesis
VPSRDPGGGDTTYLQTLAAQPPEGVTYEPYDKALERGALVEHGTRDSLRHALSTRSGVLGEALTVAANKPLQILRSRRVLFNEPFRFYEVKPGEYDLIHMHIFSAHFNALDCPLVMSSGGALRHLYIDERRYSRRRVHLLEQADRALGRLLRVDVSSESLHQAERAIVLTRSGFREIRRRHLLPPSRLDYIPLYLPPTPEGSVRRPAPGHVPRRVGFISRDFATKGGHTVLQAWQTIHRARPDAELLLVGSQTPPPELAELQKSGANITWMPYIAREELLGQVMPSLDVFAYPTLNDYLPCYTQLEVMARGVPVAGSTHRNFAESLGGEPGAMEGPAGLLCRKNDSQGLAANILRLLEPEENRLRSQGALQQFEENFSARVVLPQIKRCYEAALGRR